MTDVKEKEAAQKCSFVTVDVEGSFACLGYIYSDDPKRVFTFRSCMSVKRSLKNKEYRKSILVKATSDQSGVKNVLGTTHFLVLFVSIYT